MRIRLRGTVLCSLMRYTASHSSSMSANFWKSSHCNSWTIELNKDKIKEAYKSQEGFSYEEVLAVHNVFAELLLDTGKALGLKQRVVATAVVFFKRFYLGNLFVEVNPWLLSATALYVSSKVEESRVKVDEICKALCGLLRGPQSQQHGLEHLNKKMILECECYLLTALRFQLVVYHPYRTLQQYLRDAKIEHDCLQLGWAIVNDSYRTDICLRTPPHLIAAGAVHIAASYHLYDTKQWMMDAGFNVEEVLGVAKELLTIYHEYEKSDKLPPASAPILEKVAKACPSLKAFSEESSDPNPGAGDEPTSEGRSLPSQANTGGAPIDVNAPSPSSQR